MVLRDIPGETGIVGRYAVYFFISVGEMCMRKEREKLVKCRYI